MKKKLFISDVRMLEFMDWCIQVGKADSQEDWCSMIGFAKQNIYNVRQGNQGFQKEHILKACKVFGANANWFFDLELNMIRNSKIKKPIDLLKEAVKLVDVALTQKIK